MSARSQVPQLSGALTTSGFSVSFSARAFAAILSRRGLCPVRLETSEVATEGVAWVIAIPAAEAASAAQDGHAMSLCESRGRIPRARIGPT